MKIIRLQGIAEKRAGIYYEYDADSQPLGEGGMGRVFKGFRVNERTGERLPIAIKAIYENIPERVIDRARREAAIQLDHENLIRMYGFVEDEDETSGRTHYHVIMELLVGVTLEDMLKGVTQDKNGLQIPFAADLYGQYLNNRIDAIVRIMKALLSGLMALHDRGIIHRDIDPSNIMITFDNKIKLIDFGICKQIVSLASQDKGLTASGVFMGKVNYAAPELVLGDVSNQNYTTDIYAAGIILYQLVAGHLPFFGTDQEILTANLRSAIPLREIKNSDVKKIIRKATEKSQQKRFQSVAEMRVELEHIRFRRNDNPFTVRLLAIAACALAIIGLTVGVILISDDNATSKAINDMVRSDSVASPPTPLTSQILYDSAIAYMSAESEDSIIMAKNLLLTLACDSTYVPAMREYGVMYAKPTKYFPDLAARQKLMHIQPDLDESNKWLMKVLEQDPTDYKAAYWIYNNLMTKVEEGSVTADERIQLASVFDLFKQIVSVSIELDVEKYKEAMVAADDENTLKAWAIIQ